MKKFYTLILCSFLFSPLFVLGQLSGTYIINSSGGGNFTSLQDAAQALNTQGMSGPVTLRLANGVYNEQAEFDIPGQTANQLLTIESLSGNVEDVVISYTEADEETNYQLLFKGIQALTIKNLSINTANNSYGTGIVFHEECRNILIDNIDHKGNRNDVAIIGSIPIDIFSPIEPVENFTVINSHFYECSPSIQVGRSSWTEQENKSSHITIANNTFFDADGVVVYSGKNIEIKENLAYGVQYYVQPVKLSFCSNTRVSENVMYKTFKTIDIRMCDATQEEPVIVANNFISGRDEIITLSSNNHLLFAYNSVYSDYDQTFFSSMSNQNTRVYNNIIYQNNTAGGIFVVFEDGASFDYNCLYSNGYYAFDVSGGSYEYLNYTEYKDATQREAHGISVQPNFEIPGEDLHVSNQALSVALPLEEVTTDIDGELRSSMFPTIGADEMDGIVIANDLTIDTVITSGNLNGGEQLTISWTGQNLSNNTFSPPWIDRVFLSDDQVLDASDQELHNYQVVEALSPFQSYSRQVVVDLDLALEGTKYIIVKIDADANLLEDNSNNVAVSAPFTITPPDLPNLVVTDITMPGSVWSGTTLQIDFTIKNTGQAPAVGDWTDFIWYEDLITNFDLSVGTYKLIKNPNAKVNNPIGLLPGESYQSTALITVPYATEGYRYIRVETDGYDNVIEEVGHNDNFTHAIIDSVFVNQSPLADLIIVDIQVPAQGFAGEEITVSYEVKNNGTEITSPVPKPYNYYMGWTWAPLTMGSWLDYVYISDGVLDFSPDHYEAVHIQGDLLDVDETYIATKNIQLPECTSGEYYITVYTDRWNHVAELVENNNAIVSAPIQVIARPAPDLVPSTTDELQGMVSNSTHTLTYTVENLGADTAFAAWSDRVFLSHSSTFNYDIDEMTASELRNVTLAPNHSASFNITFDIPPHMYGEVYLYLWVDATAKVCEYPNEENNILKIPVTIEMSPAADLEVSFIQPDETVVAGDDLFLQAAIKNVGDDVPNNFVWTDRIFLKNEVSAPNDTMYVENYPHSNILPINVSYNLPTPFQIPLETPPGFYRVGVIADFYDEVWENELKDNNLVISDVFQVVVDSSRSPDLQPNALISQNWNSGHEYEVEVTIINTGNTISSATWVDELSLQDTLGNVLSNATSFKSGSLASGGEYTAIFQIQIPPGTPQHSVFEVRIDTSHAVFEYNKLNNIAKFNIEITPGPAPDLSPTNLEVPQYMSAGQELSLSVIRNNFGDKAIESQNWTERVLLSADNKPDKYDYVLKSYAYLDDDMPAQYTDVFTDEIKIPMTMVGTYYLIYFMDAGNHIPEGEFEDNNYIVSEYPVEISVPLPVDFHSEFVSLEMTDDNPRWLKYNLTNTSTNTFEGKFYNTYYLSKDNQYSTDDILLGVDAILDYDVFYLYRKIEPGETIEETAHLIYAPVVAGDYYLIQKIDAFLNVYETDETNNTFVFGPFFIDNIPEIVADSTYSKRFGQNLPIFNGIFSALVANGGDNEISIPEYSVKGLKPKSYFDTYDPGYDPHPDRHDFKIQIPDGFGMITHMWEDEALNTTSGVTAIDKPIYEMYIGEEFVPTPGQYDFKFDKPMQNEQIILVPVAGERMDYIKTRGPYLPPMMSSSEPVRNNYLLRAEFREFSVYKIHPDKVGNSHNVTLRITGFDFSDTTGFDVALIQGTDTTYAFEVYPQDHSEIVAYIDMRGKNPGNYDLLVRKQTTGATTIWDQKVEVIDDESGIVFANLKGPSSSRSEFDFQVALTYGNKGYSNIYDMIAIVAVFMDDSTSAGLDVSYLGSTYPGYDGYGFISTEECEAEIIELGVLDDAVYYGVYIPIVHARSEETLHFMINGEVPGEITVQASLGLLQRSPYTFTGRVEDAGTSQYIVLLDHALAGSEEILQALGKAGGGDDCEQKLDVDNMVQRIAHQTYKVAERARGASSFTSDVKKSVKTMADHEAGIQAKFKSYTKMIDIKKKLSLTANEDTPFYTEIKDIFDCMGPDASIQPAPDEKCRQIARFNRDGVEFEVKVNMGGYISGCPTLEEMHPYPEKKTHEPKDKITIENRNSKDPNEIVGPSGSGPARVVSNDDEFTYTVYFENVAQASAPAARVHIDNPLDSNLRLASFRITSFGFADTVFNFNSVPFLQENFELGSAYHNDLLRVIAGTDPERNKAFFEFSTIDAQTKAPVTGANNGFLLPNDSAGRGQGFVTYIIEPKRNLDPGTVIKNKAAIVFDGNEIIETNTWSNVISGGELESTVLVLPTFSPEEFTVEWVNKTPPFGPPVSGFDIYVRDVNGDDNRWKKWLGHVKYYSKTFQGEPGHTYEFYSQAHADGLLEELGTTPQAVTTVLEFKGNVSDGKPLIFPNPAIGRTTMAYRSPGIGAAMRVDLTEPTGKRVMSQKFTTTGSGVLYHDISLQKLAPGVYIVTLYHNDTKVGSTKFVTLGVNKD